MNTVRHERARARHRLHRPQRAELPALRPAPPRARRARPAARRCRSRSAAATAGSSGPAAGRSRRAGGWRTRASSRSCARSSAGCARRGLARGRDLEGRTLGAYVDERGYSQRFRRHFLVPLTSALWSTRARAGARVPGRVRDPLLRAPRDARASAAPLADGRGGADTYVAAMLERLRGRGPSRARRPSGPARRPTASSSSPRTARPAASTRSSSRRTPTRRSRSSPTRATTSAGCSARCGTRRTTPCSTPTSASCHAPAARGSWNYHAERIEQADRHVLPEPAPAPRLRRRTTASRSTARTRSIPRRTLMRTVFTHPLYTLESLAAQAELPRSPASGTRCSPARTTATASTRTASPPACARPPRWG